MRFNGDSTYGEVSNDNGVFDLDDDNAYTLELGIRWEFPENGFSFLLTKRVERDRERGWQIVANCAQ